ncbi:MAG: SDR family NAD(P)-dependent oxidoreductase [Victivallales bacterium]|nr:SDR family NAD(P)-dependent oxidoreductase [Victivallales bacterium]
MNLNACIMLPGESGVYKKILLTEAKMPYDSLNGKNVLVTGAGTGIGRGIALAFAKSGANVILHYSRSSAGADSAVAEITAAGGKAAAFKADFREFASLEELASRTVALLGGLDVLVNSAGITLNQDFEKVSAPQFDILYQVNVRAPFFLTQALLPELKKSRGVVINISSIHAFEGYREHSVYAGTRGAIVAFTRELAIELAPLGIRVVGIAPGSIEVESHYKMDPEYDPKAHGNGIPAGFTGQPSDIGNAAVFLAAEEGRYILGQTIIVDGGISSWMPFGDGFKKPMNCCFGKDYVPGR